MQVTTEGKRDEGAAEEGGEEGPMSVHPALGRDVGVSHVEGGNGHLGDANGDEEIDLGDGRELVRYVEFVLSGGFHRETECGKASGCTTCNREHVLAAAAAEIDHGDLKRGIADCEKLDDIVR